MLSIPSHIFWPGFIIAILGICMGSGMSIIVASASDGGPRIVPDYYEKAVAWDESVATDEASRELGWTVALSINDERAEVAVRDRQGQPLTLSGSASFRLASDVEPRATVPLIARPDGQPGHYILADAPLAPGVWDVTLHLQSGETTYERTHRVERSP